MAELALLDTDTLSEVMKGLDANVRENARQYLTIFGAFTFSIITRYEILRGVSRHATLFANWHVLSSGASAVRCCR
jgi:predicted nucleic acid-binding protein